MLQPLIGAIITSFSAYAKFESPEKDYFLLTQIVTKVMMISSMHIGSLKSSSRPTDDFKRAWRSRT
jgi:hypothetical protein